MRNQNRQPAGAPSRAGGQFSSGSHDEAANGLAPERPMLGGMIYAESTLDGREYFMSSSHHVDFGSVFDRYDLDDLPEEFDSAEFDEYALEVMDEDTSVTQTGHGFTVSIDNDEYQDYLNRRRELGLVEGVSPPLPQHEVDSRIRNGLESVLGDTSLRGVRDWTFGQASNWAGRGRHALSKATEGIEPARVPEEVSNIAQRLHSAAEMRDRAGSTAEIADIFYDIVDYQRDKDRVPF